MKGFYIGLGSVLFVLASSVGTWLLFNYFTDQYIASQSSEPIKNLKYERDTFMKFCVDGALENNGVTLETANNYCGCVIDDGLELYGNTKFTQLMTDLGNTNIVSPEVNGLINKCLQKVEIN